MRERKNIKETKKKETLEKEKEKMNLKNERT
jgi:hypothetical protein